MLTDLGDAKRGDSRHRFPQGGPPSLFLPDNISERDVQGRIDA